MSNFDELNAALDLAVTRLASVKGDTETLLATITQLQQNPPTGMTADQQAALDTAVIKAQGISDALGSLDGMVPAPAAPAGPVAPAAPQETPPVNQAPAETPPVTQPDTPAIPDATTAPGPTVPTTTAAPTTEAPATPPADATQPQPTAPADVPATPPTEPPVTNAG